MLSSGESGQPILNSTLTKVHDSQTDPFPALTSDRSIPYNTFAKAVVDTASSLGQSGDKGFFRNQAQTHIAVALETLREIGADVTLENAHRLLLNQGDLDEAMADLASGQQTPRRRELTAHFTNRFLTQPPEQIGGVKESSGAR